MVLFTDYVLAEEDKFDAGGWMLCSVIVMMLVGNMMVIVYHVFW